MVKPDGTLQRLFATLAVGMGSSLSEPSGMARFGRNVGAVIGVVALLVLVFSWNIASAFSRIDMFGLLVVGIGLAVVNSRRIPKRSEK